MKPAPVLTSFTDYPKNTAAQRGKYTRLSWKCRKRERRFVLFGRASRAVARGKPKKHIARLSPRQKSFQGNQNWSRQKVFRRCRRELAFLDMPSVKFIVNDSVGELYENGIDNIEFCSRQMPAREPETVVKNSIGRRQKLCLPLSAWYCLSLTTSTRSLRRDRFRCERQSGVKDCRKNEETKNTSSLYA